MGERRWLILAALILLPLSALLYFTHYLLFHDAHHIFIYLVGDLAFLPCEIFLVVIVVERLLARHEKQMLLEKMNMLIGMFYKRSILARTHPVQDEPGPVLRQVRSAAGLGIVAVGDYA